MIFKFEFKNLTARGWCTVTFLTTRQTNCHTASKNTSIRTIERLNMSKMKALTRIVADHRPQAFQQFSAFDH